MYLYFSNGNWSIPIEVLVDRPYVDGNEAELRVNLTQTGDILTWAPGWVAWDDPASIKETGEAGEMVAALRRKLDTVENKLTIESACFVVGDDDVAKVKELIDNGFSMTAFL